ncbi:elongator complex protein-like protein 1, partial [Polyplosphaeria fusca]
LVMRNLRIVGRSLLRFSGEDPLPLTATAWDAATNSVICAFGPSKSRAVIELKRLHYSRINADERLESIASWDAPCPLPTLPCDSILNLQHFSDTGTTCLVLAGGDIILVRENPAQHEDAIEIIGSVDAGISAAAWSPDEELITIATLADTLLLMTREIEQIADITLRPDDVNISNHVSVGWGKKETQFQGKRAKALKDPTVPEHVDEGVLSPFDDKSMSISWRGDGAYFCVTRVEQDRRRMVRVYSREGQLDGVSEPVDGLEGALSWRPSGNLIAGIKRSTGKVEIVFFERNGLRHGQFDLRLTTQEMQSLAVPLGLEWNSDSSVLAVSYPDKIQLWTMSNYHYYLKQELAFPEHATKTVLCNWHSERPLSLTLATPSSLEILEYVSTTAAGPVQGPNDFGLIASVDGLTLNITPLRVANIPPPMSLLQLKLELKAVDVAFSASNSHVAVLSNEDVAVYAVDVTKRPIQRPSLLWRDDSIKGSCPRQVSFAGNDQVIVLTDSWDEDESSLWLGRDGKLTCRGPILEPGQIAGLVSSVDLHTTYLQFRDGVIHSVVSDIVDDLPLQTSLIQTLPAFVQEAKVVEMDGKIACFGLTKGGILQANDRILVRNCTSFAVTPAHLIFTTTQHLLKFIHLTSIEELEVPPDEPQKDERCRSVERGAKIVTVMPTTFSVVLQMHRGNLETIYPRALVLAAIRRCIEDEQFGKAFLACRNQRVDMNILHDHDPDRFMANVANIVAQVKKVEHIDLLLSQLRNEDVSETMYKETLKSKDRSAKTQQSQTAIDTKVNRICEAFLAILEQSQHKEAHLQNVITAHVCKTPPDLEAGLEVIGNLQATKNPLTDKAAEHICFLTDVNQLYDTSLGIYNLELALLIAQQSQKDPREYLPHLQSLHDLPPLRRKFKIDDQLGRKDKALTHLKDLDDFEEVKDYIQKHALYPSALSFYQYDTPRLREVTHLYADYLSIQNRHKEAALAYDSLSLHASAWLCYRSAHLWREALSSATLAGLSAEELTSLAQSLADGLTESKDYASAATLHLDYLSDLPTCIKLLCKAHLFAEATRLLALHHQPALLTTILDPSLTEASA